MVTKRQPKAPPMTQAEALHFDRFSVANAVMVKAVLPCGCEPYEDVFTYRRWQAQGYQVERGSKAIKIPTVRTVDHENKLTGEIEQRKLFHTSAVFCRHQVKGG